ncbi:sigma-70 family RNA polymerase sigma factor [Brevibacterium sp. XM4083]|uniref:RNA polymerase sigma factor n=2 Tax=unclassified Brevibacterium TaxID=2614124 RepID=UPI00112CE6A3|nr:sigma-70 family RNA polymerase sigma factor [Brevibacterium sp. XM4083]MCM1013763.1 sigma-70 family RNA polymerase sigma factor [Brevibacterium sp. XM4083]
MSDPRIPDSASDDPESAARKAEHDAEYDSESAASAAEDPEAAEREAADAELCTVIVDRGPDSEAGRRAFAQLYARHRLPALHFALRLTGDYTRAEDAVAEAFAKIWRAWGNGAGPQESFKSYLMTAVRSESFRLTAMTGATTTVEPDVLAFLAGGTSRDHASEVSERDQLGRAFRTLPATWQTAITLIDIDGTPTAAAAESLGLSVNSFHSLLHRAREGLRTAYLQEHVEPAKPSCAEYSSELARYVRNQLGIKRGKSVETHLRHCRYCRRQSVLLTKINTKLGAWLTPAVLAGALIESEQFPEALAGAAGGATAPDASAAQNSETVFFSPESAGGQGGSSGTGSGFALGLKIAAAVVIATAAIAAGVWALNPNRGTPEAEGPTSSPVQPETGLTDDDLGDDVRSPAAPPEAGSPDAEDPAGPDDEGPRNAAPVPAQPRVPAPPAPGEPGGPNAEPPAPRDPGPGNPGPGDPGPGDPGPGDPGPGEPAPPPAPPTDPPQPPSPTQPPTTPPPPTPSDPPTTSPPPTSPPPTTPPPTSPPPTSPPPTSPPPTTPTPTPTPSDPGGRCHDVGWGWHCH